MFITYWRSIFFVGMVKKYTFSPLQVWDNVGRITTSTRQTGVTDMTNYEIITKGDWTFKPIRAEQWQVLLKGEHFAYVSTAAILRALAEIEEA